MRIALVIQKLGGLRGGAERVVTELANALVDRGHSVTVLTFELSELEPAYPLHAELVNLFPSSVRTVLQMKSKGRDDLAGAVEGGVSRSGNRAGLAHAKWHATHGVFARRLRRWLRTHAMDSVVGFLPPAISAVANAGAGLGPQRPRLIGSTHNLPAVDFGQSDRWDQNPVARSRNLDALEEVDTVTVLQQEFIEQLPPGARLNAVVVPNPVAPATGELDRLASREKLVLGVGRLTSVKRYDILIESFARLSDEFPGWSLEIYGEGPERTSLTNLIDRLDQANQIRLAGVSDDIEAHYRRARVLGHPARYEGFGLSVSEAIAHRVPVVGFRSCAGIRDLVEPGRSGILVADGLDEFTDGLREMMGSPPDDDTLNAAADRLVRRLGSDQIRDLWEEILVGEVGPSPNYTSNVG